MAIRIFLENRFLTGSGRLRRIAGEALVLAEFAALMRDPIYRGEGVPRGDGRLVVIIPGLFGNDLYLWPLRRWISRIGYRPSTSGLWVNAGCGDRLSSEIARWIDRQQPQRDRPIVLIGHSRGGLLARALAARLGRRVSHLIALGSPIAPTLFAQPGSSPHLEGGIMDALAQASTTARRMLDPECRFPECGCAFVNDVRRPLASETAILSIHSRDDQIVPPAASIATDARNVEVRGTHSGLVYNPAVYRELARSLR